jgi:chromosome segregation ATPase
LAERLVASRSKERDSATAEVAALQAKLESAQEKLAKAEDGVAEAVASRDKLVAELGTLHG